MVLERRFFFMFKVWSIIVLTGGIASTQKAQGSRSTENQLQSYAVHAHRDGTSSDDNEGQNIIPYHKSGKQCGVWVRNDNGGYFASPNYPNVYPPNRECIYILEAAPRQRIELTFDESYNIEPSWDCRFDHLEVRDGPFGFSRMINRYCGQKNPALIKSSGRFLWIKFSSDEELEGFGFRAKYSFVPDPDFIYLGGILNPIPDCQFELSGPDGIIHSSQVEQEEKIKPGEAIDCIWTIRAPPKAKVCYVCTLQKTMHREKL